MKQFKDFNEAFNWTNKVIEKATDKALKSVAEQVYEDSKKYTYIDTQEMYDSGERSNFDDGIITIQAPQVRWLYYTQGITPHKNKSAVPQWFEATKIEHKNDYKNMVVETIKQQKKE